MGVITVHIVECLFVKYKQTARFEIEVQQFKLPHCISPTNCQFYCTYIPVFKTTQETSHVKVEGQDSSFFFKIMFKVDPSVSPKLSFFFCKRDSSEKVCRHLGQLHCVDVHITRKFEHHHFSRNFEPFEIKNIIMSIY